MEIQHDEPAGELVAIGLIDVPPELRQRYSKLTEFVIVSLWRSTGHDAVRVLRDGWRELLPALRPALRPEGKLLWQIDAGRLIDDPVVGPIWYQSHGSACEPDTPVVGRFCGMVQPPS